MALEMRVQTEKGEPKESDVYVPFDAIPFDEGRFPILSSVARYYHTTFNPHQLARIVAEWAKPLRNHSTKEPLEQWRIVRDTAARCATEQLYLKFIDD